MKLIDAKDLQPHDKFVFAESPDVFYMTSFPYLDTMAGLQMLVLPCIAMTAPALGCPGIAYKLPETKVWLQVPDESPQLRRSRKVSELVQGDFFSFQNSPSVYCVTGPVVPPDGHRFPAQYRIPTVSASGRCRLISSHGSTCVNLQ